MCSDDRILGTFKFSSAEHIKQFAQGLLFMNTLKYFGSIEKNYARNDPREGASRIVQGRGPLLQVKTGERWEPVGTILGPVHHLSDPKPQMALYRSTGPFGNRVS
jgi:hypothetical protein